VKTISSGLLGVDQRGDLLAGHVDGLLGVPAEAVRARGGVAEIFSMKYGIIASSTRGPPGVVAW
jgi:hypothetical protein